MKKINKIYDYDMFNMVIISTGPPPPLGGGGTSGPGTKVAIDSGTREKYQSSICRRIFVVGVSVGRYNTRIY